MISTVFLLGAGASADADFPLMADLTQGFPPWLADQDVSGAEKFLTVYEAVTELVKEVDVQEAPNIEFVMRFLTDLHVFKESYHEAVHGWSQPIGALTTAEIDELLELLRQYMKHSLKLRDRGGSGDYLDGLFDFIPPDGSGLDIFTLNYDRLLEARCSLREKRFTTGFGDAWAPTLFDADAWDIRIHKLHGSLDWYRLPRSGLVYRGDESHYAYPGEKPASAALYPAGTKAAYAEPFSTLRSRFIQALGEANRLIVVGYRFADEHIRRVVLDRLRTNQELEVIVVDPKAEKIIFMERPSEEEPIFSDFPDRVEGLWATGRAAFQNRQITVRQDEMETASGLKAAFLEQRGKPDFSNASAHLLGLVDYLWEKDLPGKAEVLLAEVQGTAFRDALTVRMLAEVRWIRHRWGTQTKHPKIQPARSLGAGRPFLQLVLRWLLAHALELQPVCEMTDEGIVERLAHWMAGLVVLRGDEALAWPIDQAKESRDATLPIKIRDQLTEQIELLEPRKLGFPWREHLPVCIREKAAYLEDDLRHLRHIYELHMDHDKNRIRRVGRIEVLVRSDSDSQLAYLDEASTALVESGFLERWGQNPSWRGKRKRLAG